MNWKRTHTKRMCGYVEAIAKKACFPPIERLWVAPASAQPLVIEIMVADEECKRFGTSGIERRELSLPKRLRRQLIFERCRDAITDWEQCPITM